MPAGECCTCKWASNVRDGAEKGVAPHRICDCKADGTWEHWVDVDSDEDCDTYEAQPIVVPDQPAHRWRYIQAMRWWECQDCGAIVTKQDWASTWGQFKSNKDALPDTLRDLIFAWIVAKKREGQAHADISQGH